jgi:flagellar basal-body rod protein FlgB
MVEPVYLFSLIERQQSWLSSRQALVAQNVSNANTAGYRAVDLVPFAKVLDRSALQMSGTNGMHLQTSTSDLASGLGKPSAGWEVSYSGNSVNLEQEMIKAGDIRGAYSLDTSIKRAFHNMWMTSVKG